MPRDSSDTNRRRFLKSTGGVAAVSALAGCPQGSGDGEGDGGDTPTENETATAAPETQTPGEVDENEEVPRGGTFTVGLPEPPDNLNPLASNSAYSSAIYEAVYTSGVYIDPITFEVHPWMYSDWTVENADTEEPDIYVDVRTDTDITWQDGEEFTVDDVIFSHNYFLEQEPAGWSDYFGPVDSVQEADNDWDVHISLNQQNATWEASQLSIYLLPEHIWSDIDDHQTYRPTENDGPIGLGPAEVTQYEPDTSIELEFMDPEEFPLTQLEWMEQHDNLRSGGPFLDRVRFLVFSEQQQQINALLNDEVDSLYGSMPTQGVQDVQEAEGKRLVRGEDDGYGYVGMNLRRSPFDDVTFRQAMGFLWDEVYWVERLNRNTVIDGDFVCPPGYTAGRPETSSDDVELLTDPATEAFSFRQAQAGVPDFEGIREFLTNGEIIDGSEGTYVGQDYPGSITGVNTAQQESKYDYEFTDDVQSDILQDANAQQELLINGQRVTEIHDGPIEYLSYPPSNVPELTQMDETYVQNMRQLGIPVERSVVSFNSLTDQVFVQEDFDFCHMGWSSPPFPISTLYALFHSDNADDHSEVEEGSEQENAQAQRLNMTGYGLFDDATADEFIEAGQNTMDSDVRDENTWQAVERIYLDMPYMVYQYEKVQWPVNSADFDGFLEGIVAPGGGYITDQYYQIHQTE